MNIPRPAQAGRSDSCRHTATGISAYVVGGYEVAGHEKILPYALFDFCRRRRGYLKDAIGEAGLRPRE
jgi:hypothetical protein